MYKFFGGVVLGILIVLLLMQIIGGVSPPGQVEKEIKHDTITIPFDSIQVRDSIVYRWKASDPVILKSIDTLFAELNGADSMKIATAVFGDLRKYNMTNVFDDTIKNDSAAFIRIREQVCRNRVFGRVVTYKNNVKQRYVNKRGLYGHALIGKRMLNIGFRLDLNQKVDYICGYNIMENLYYCGVSCRIF